MDNPMKLVIGISTRGDDLTAGNVAFLLKLAKRRDIQCDFLFSVCRISASRSQEYLLQLVGKVKDYTHFLMMDSDVIPTMRSFNRLVEADKDIITMPVYHFAEEFGDVHLNVARNEDGGRMYKIKEQDFVEEVTTTSLACALIKRKVIDAFVKEEESFFHHTPTIGAPKHNEGGETDFIFFSKIKKFGFKVWVDWGVKDTTHRRLIDLNHATMAYLAEEWRQP